MEAPIGFPPTYKFDAGSDVYDSSRKQRVPSWTDRVLFKPSPSLVVRAYGSAPALRSSDHRPVFADLVVALNPAGLAAAVAGLDGGERRGEAGEVDPALFGQSKSQVCALM